MTDPTRTARELLAFYAEAGVTAMLGDEPVNRLDDSGPGSVSALPASAPSAALPAATPPPPASRLASITLPPKGGMRETPRPAAGNAPPSPEAAAAAAREAARSAASLDELRAILERFEGCALRVTASRLVFADGNPAARLMLVGEAPGYEEDKQGLPFVGRSGQLLDRMLAAIGLTRSAVYIANIVPWRPPGNRTPTPQESAICLPFIQRQIELADPDLLVCLGGPSTQTLLAVKDGILKVRGRFLPYHTGTREIRALATLHPAYLLRQPLQKRLAWRDFLTIKRALAG
jgi:uracil-DNA glycosylase family 4